MKQLWYYFPELSSLLHLSEVEWIWLIDLSEFYKRSDESFSELAISQANKCNRFPEKISKIIHFLS